jgi:hypothetical protein
VVCSVFGRYLLGSQFCKVGVHEQEAAAHPVSGVPGIAARSAH